MLLNQGSSPRLSSIYFYFINWILLSGKEDLLGLPGGSAVFAGNTFHQRHQFTLRADAADSISDRGISFRLHTVAVTHTFDIIGAEFQRGPITQRLGGWDQILIPVPGMEGFLQFTQRRGVPQRESPAFGAAQPNQIGATAQLFTE